MEECLRAAANERPRLRAVTEGWPATNRNDGGDQNYNHSLIQPHPTKLPSSDWLTYSQYNAQSPTTSTYTKSS